MHILYFEQMHVALFLTPLRSVYERLYRLTPEAVVKWLILLSSLSYAGAVIKPLVPICSEPSK